MAFLTTRVQAPDEDDWGKLKRLLKYIHGTIHLKLSLDAVSLSLMHWWVDAAYGVHPDYRSHSGAVMSFGKGGVISMSCKQKINTKSSTEEELVAVDDASGLILWARRFMEDQGYNVKEAIVYQDNQSAILLETKGKDSSERRTRHMNVRYFFIKDQVDAREVAIKYCPATGMIGDHFGKPLQGILFFRFHSQIMNIPEDIPEAELSWDE